MTWTHGLVGMLLACSATAHAAPDISCDRSQRSFVARSIVDDHARLVLVQPQRLSLPTIEIEPVSSMRVVFGIFESRRVGWDALKDLVLAAKPLSILDVAAAVADLTRAFANARTPAGGVAVSVTLTNIDGSLYTQWAAADLDEPAFRLLRIAPGYEVSAAFHP